jgi:hypothetical protein
MRTVSVPYTLIDDEAFDLQKDLYTVQWKGVQSQPHTF